MVALSRVVLAFSLVFSGVIYSANWSGSSVGLRLKNQILKTVNSMLVEYIKNSNSRDVNITINTGDTTVNTGDSLTIDIGKIKGANNFDIESNNTFGIINKWTVDDSTDALLSIEFTWKDKIKGSNINGSAQLYCMKNEVACRINSQRISGGS